MKKLFIGIDVSKDVFDYCCLDQENKIVLRGKADNTKEGIKEFLQADQYAKRLFFLDLYGTHGIL